jgi:hypothetical protein
MPGSFGKFFKRMAGDKQVHNPFVLIRLHQFDGDTTLTAWMILQVLRTNDW